MVESITSGEEEEFRNFPKIDRGRLYSVLLIILIMVLVYISIIINQFWIAVFVIIPILSISKREEVSQAKFDLKQKAIDSISQLVKIVIISVVVGSIIFLFIKTGILITSILIFISFSLYSYISATFTRRNFEKSNTMKSEVF